MGIKPDATPDEIRHYIRTKVSLRDCQDPATGQWISPITDEAFDSFYALSGHIGHLTRTVRPTPLTPDRKGYIKAVRRGIEPTEEQREANKKYMREFRQRKKALQRASA